MRAVSFPRPSSTWRSSALWQILSSPPGNLGKCFQLTQPQSSMNSSVEEMWPELTILFSGKLASERLSHIFWTTWFDLLPWPRTPLDFQQTFCRLPHRFEGWCWIKYNYSFISSLSVETDRILKSYPVTKALTSGWKPCGESRGGLCKVVNLKIFLVLRPTFPDPSAGEGLWILLI